jgi:hypothetical protein
MKTKLITTALVLLAVAADTDRAVAQGTAFTYQGVLTDNGAPANGVCDLAFTLFNASSGGSPVGARNVVNDFAVTNGLLTVPLDFGTAPFDGSDRWLQVAVRPGASAGAFTDLSPRQPITSSPYAIRAANFSGPVAASQLTGVISSSNIAAGSITRVMLANGAVGSDQLAAGAVSTAALANGAVTAAKISTPMVFTASVITNPTPLAFDQFGTALAVLGDKVLVGASQDDQGGLDSGVAHLFNASGQLGFTLTNPTPALSDHFGQAVALGADKLLVGADQDDAGAVNAGSVYVFDISGALMRTLTNPTPRTGDNFGFAVAVLPDGGFAVGSPRDNPGAGRFGAVHLYNRGSRHVDTIANPTPADLDLFGSAVAPVGMGNLLIGAPSDDLGMAGAGVAYLFKTNGMLQTTFTNPTPASDDAFGTVVAAVGTDKVLITAPSDNTGGTDAGAAYLFNLEGDLLTTFTNPAPFSGDGFGSAAVAVAQNRVLIAASAADSGAFNAGIAYLFDLKGNLLLTFTNPAPAASDHFGSAVAALDGNRIVLGARMDDTGVGEAGAVHILSFDTFTPGLIADTVRSVGVTSIGALLALAHSAIFVTNDMILQPTTSFVQLHPTSLSVRLNSTTALSDGSSIGTILVLQVMAPSGGAVEIPTSANTSAHTLGHGDTLTLIWDGAAWVKLSSSNN